MKVNNKLKFYRPEKWIVNMLNQIIKLEKLE
jgi:hypothetical protein